MAASELLENAVKYAEGEETRVRVSLSSNSSEVSISVSNKANKEAIDALRAIWGSVMTGDPLEAYLKMMREAATRSDGKSQLGLVRIRYETGGAMSLKAEGDVVTIASSTQNDGLSPLRDRRKDMNGLGIEQIKQGKVGIDVSDIPSGVAVTIVGEIDMQDPSLILDPLFDKIHKGAMSSGLKLVNFDLKTAQLPQLERDQGNSQVDHEPGERSGRQEVRHQDTPEQEHLLADDESADADLSRARGRTA